MSVPTDFLAAWRHQLGLCNVGTKPRSYKIEFLLAVAAGVTDKTKLDELVHNVGLFSTVEGSNLVKATVNHLAALGEGSADLRRQLGELVPANERPKA